MSVDQMELIADVYPLRRDIVSDGYDKALAVLGRAVPIHVHRYATGTPCWTWRVPPKWTCEDAYVAGPDGRRLIDQRDHPLHVASYSVPVDAQLGRDELLAHLHVHPHLDDQPPFVFHYYQKNWSFGCGRRIRDALADDAYRAVIRARFEPGHLKVGEITADGAGDDCFVLCAHLCHPGQVNDGLSGVATGIAVMESLRRRRRLRYSYRMLIVPETIGSVAWLSHHEHLLARIKGGLFLDMTGLCNPPALQMSYTGDTPVDRCLRRVHLSADPEAWCAPHRTVVGNDERQFNAPGVRIPMLSYSRALPREHPHRPFEAYHSPADNLELLSAAKLNESRDAVLAMIDEWEIADFPQNRFKGEVCLAEAGLAVDRHRDLVSHRQMLQIMDHIDGAHTTADIAELADMSVADVDVFVRKLVEAGLVEAGGHDHEPRAGAAHVLQSVADLSCVRDF